MQSRMMFIVVLLSLISVPILSKKLEFDTDIQISLDKDTYYMKERTILKIEVMNFNDFGPMVTSHISSQCIIKNVDGKKYPVNYQISYPDSWFMTADEVRTFTVDIQEMYGKPHPDMWALRGVLPPGQYTVQTIWREAGHEPIKSNIITFDIISPIGMDKKALESLWQYTKYLNEKEDDKASDELLRFFTEYKL